MAGNQKLNEKKAVDSKHAPSHAGHDDARAATHSMHSDVSKSIHQVEDTQAKARKVAHDAKADADNKAVSDLKTSAKGAKPELKKK